MPEPKCWKPYPTPLHKYNKDNLSATLKGNKSTYSYKTIECDACLRNCKSKFNTSHDFTPPIPNFRKGKTRNIYKIQIKEHTKTYDQTKIKVYTCATDSVPPLDIRDELSIPELHLYHPYHQLIPGNSFYNHHQTPSLSRKETTEITKNLPKVNTLHEPPTSPEPTQPRGLDK